MNREERLRERLYNLEREQQEIANELELGETPQWAMFLEERLPGFRYSKRTGTWWCRHASQECHTKPYFVSIHGNNLDVRYVLRAVADMLDAVDAGDISLEG